MTYHNLTIAQLSDELQNACTALALHPTPEQIQKLLMYLDLLLFWSKTYNLTAITTPKEALIKHIVDCLAVIPPFEAAILQQKNTTSAIRILDVGTGAGLPALILAIMRPDWQVVALDKSHKKIRFVRQMISQLTINNCDGRACRIEECTDTFDIVTSRAFASLTDFVALTASRLALGGALCALKGKIPQDEIMQLTDWQSTVVPLVVPGLSDERCLVVLSAK